MMQPNGENNGDEEAEGPLADQTHLRVLDIRERRPVGHEMHALTEPGLQIVRARVHSSSTHEIGNHLEVSSDGIGPISIVRFRDLTNQANNSLLDAVKESITENPDEHLSFFNRAQNLSLKMHAFQLLPGVGKSTAQSWVQIRGANGWVDLDEVSKGLGVDAITLLAERYVKELENPAEVPSLLELLVRSEN